MAGLQAVYFNSRTPQEDATVWDDKTGEPVKIFQFTHPPRGCDLK
ncbi:hypothetical protein L248_0013 [Schleiferilactobacillus shenzhenensis LY-73]|uniref:Uncharacterized protein n=1 Tax=Schleiferilactobacillus shenzhenensis LY-73 TaxID=1231336 RepID=U4TSD9_9LACO|nr:hypothetical protein L248_0013 [Schleiferilactobacillus shenzhenensis LY-73]